MRAYYIRQGGSHSTPEDVETEPPETGEFREMLLTKQEAQLLKYAYKAVETAWVMWVRLFWSYQKRQPSRYRQERKPKK